MAPHNNDKNSARVIPFFLNEICDEYTKRTQELVQRRTNSIFDTIHKYIINQTEKAFAAPELERLTIQISLNPDYPLTKMDVIHRYPNNSRSHISRHDVEFEPYTGPDAALVNGTIFRHKLASALATRLTNELDFKVMSGSSTKYQFDFDMLTLRDLLK